MSPSACPSVPVSWGELLDKLTILEIKRERIARADARTHIDLEYRALGAAAASVLDVDGITPLVRQLKRVNALLWDIEDAIREQEAQAAFGTVFVCLARCVYKTNDERAALKRRINALLRSELVEEKSYADGSGTAALLNPQPAH
ncbi:MAG TPA: DUF6165 family protein [Sphingobium sp.]|nr:DUF6165 family protein [Sphingobium sp.]